MSSYQIDTTGLDVKLRLSGEVTIEQARAFHNALKAAIRPGQTKLVWVETPANPLWTITDIAATAAIAHAAGAKLAVDSTVASPVLSQPLLLGADIVMQAASLPAPEAIHAPVRSRVFQRRRFP